MFVQRVEYFVPYQAPKRNGKYPTNDEMLYLGYMAGRYGINLDGNPSVQYPPRRYQQGAIFNINSCTAEAFERNLSTIGMNFNRII